MDKNDTVTIQELRRDPVGFLRRVNKGKTITVIYRSRPFAVVTGTTVGKNQNPKSMKRMLEYAELVRGSVKAPLDPGMNYKDVYSQDMSKKYDLS